MTDPRHQLGSDAEEAVAGWLIGLGWRVLARRWRVPAGELDIVALDDAGALVAVEVRARSSGRAGMPIETIDRRRLARLRAALRQFAAETAPRHHGTRLDLVAVSREQTDAGPRWRATRLPGLDAW